MIGLAAMVYEPLYHAREIQTIKLCLVVLAKRNRQHLQISFFNTAIIPLTLVGYEMIDSLLGAPGWLSIIVSGIIVTVNPGHA